MSKESLIQWVRQQQPNLESILLSSVKDFYSHHEHLPYFPYDAKTSAAEQFQLGSGGDLCYDRPTIGFNYTLWYHPKRINTFLHYFIGLIYDAKDEPAIQVFDLGAGTGAVAWAVGLVVQGLKELGLPCPTMKVINVDTSPFMMSFNRDYLWNHFIQSYPHARDISSSNDYRLCSWSNLDQASLSNVWICASYLFDHSENGEIIVEDFKKIIDKHKPNRVLLLSAGQKSQFVDDVANGIAQQNFSNAYPTSVQTIFSGDLTRLGQFRKEISVKHSLQLMGTPHWGKERFYGRILINKTPQLLFSTDLNLNIYVKAEKNRNKIKLSEQQEKAAELTTQPTCIIGPAGCGKSVVLTQKIFNIVEDSKYDPKLRILVSTFNKDLLGVLAAWIEELMDSKRFKKIINKNQYGYPEKSVYFMFAGSIIHNISVMNFDVLPTRLVRIPRLEIPRQLPGAELAFMKGAIDQYVKEKNIDRERFSKILDPSFLLTEYHRVAYGNMCDCHPKSDPNRIKYSTVSREGRGINPQLRVSKERRTIAWAIMNLYISNLKKAKKETFIIRRHKLLKELFKKDFKNKYDHIIVDEFQDCTRADYEIFYKIIKDTNNITFAGDLAQSISLGTALHYPLRSDDPTMKRFNPKRLTGSFRLPMRISECIKPFSEMVSRKFQSRLGVNTDIITPYKGAPPGARPIFLFAKDAIAASIKVAEIFSLYKDGLNLNEITVYENDEELVTHLRLRNLTVEGEIILKTKGLEKNFVVWSSRQDVDTESEKEEFIYTILTRTVTLLIILVFPETQAAYIDIIKTFIANRLIFWDLPSEMKYLEIMQITSIAEGPADEDNSETSQNTEEGGLDGLD